jgi:diadenosine tetraphosphate (Ap4A) HIT family hydrolase
MQLCQNLGILGGGGFNTHTHTHTPPRYATATHYEYNTMAIKHWWEDTQMDLQKVQTAAEHYTEQTQERIQWQLGSVEAQFI